MEHQLNMKTCHMRTIRIYQPGHYEPGQQWPLAAEAAHHVAVVLRMIVGQQITLFCGDDREFLATLVRVQKKEVVVQVEQVCKMSRESPLAIHLAQGVSKGDRMDWVMQKAVELGVASITPILTERSVVRLDRERSTKKEAHWQSIVIHACEQCGRNQMPIVHPICTYDDFIQHCSMKSRLILHPSPEPWGKPQELPQDEVAVVIGPEGGLSSLEMEKAKQYHFQPLRLGPRILRTETAAVVALSLLQAKYGDL